jgi:protein-tyrosine phosphatase
MNSDPTKIAISFDPTVKRMVGIARHGYTPFNVPFISEITKNLWQGGCEDGLQLPEHIKHVVSLYPWECYSVHHELLSKLEVKMFDSLEQEFTQIDAIAQWVEHCMSSGPVLVHCQAGLNRSSLVAAKVLMLHYDWTGKQAIETLREKRSPACLCNPAFETYLLSL